jgi:hypothetical protein
MISMRAARSCFAACGSVALWMMFAHCNIWGLDAPKVEVPVLGTTDTDSSLSDASIDASELPPLREPCQTVGAVDEVMCEGSCSQSRTCLLEGWSAPSACACSGWRDVAAAPAEFVGRRFGSATWVSDEIILWGGSGDDGPLADGVAYRPSSNTWRVLASSPLSPRRDFVSVWTGMELLIWGGENGDRKFDDGAVYTPHLDRWRKLPSLQLGARSGAFGRYDAANQRLLIWGGELQPGSYARDGAVLALKDNVVRALTLAPSTFPGRIPTAAQAGSGNVFLGGRCSEPCFDAATLDANLEWRTFDPPPIRDGALWRDFFGVTCNTFPGDPSAGAFFFGGGRGPEIAVFGAQYSRDKGWSAIPPPATNVIPEANYMPFCFRDTPGILPGLAIIDRKIRYSDTLALYRNRQWEKLEPSGLSIRAWPYAVVFGNEVFVWGGQEFLGPYRTDGKIYKFAK